MNLNSVILSLTIILAPPFVMAKKCKDITLQGDFSQKGNVTYFNVNSKAESEFKFQVNKTKLVDLDKMTDWYYEITVRPTKTCINTVTCSVDLIKIDQSFKDISYKPKPYSIIDFAQISLACAKLK